MATLAVFRKPNRALHEGYSVLPTLTHNNNPSNSWKQEISGHTYITSLYIMIPPLQVFTNTKKRTASVNTFRAFGSSVSTIAFRPCKTKCRHNESEYFEQPISYFEIMNRFFHAYTSYAHYVHIYVQN